jgi:two-component system, LytTR family, response regulator
LALRTIIVDDEVLARRKIRSFLAEDPRFSVAAECADGRQAVAAIRSEQPDLVFLDVQMPGWNGFEVLDSLLEENLPSVIFVTAFDKYAVQAFAVRAVDYLLKPFNKNRFAEALERVLETRARGPARGRKEELKSALAELASESRERERIVVKSGSRLILLRKDAIEWVEAQGDYVRLHVGKEAHLLRETMAAVTERLNSPRFVRIHRSRIVNLDFVRELRPLWGGDYTVLLRDGTQLTLSRTYRATLETIMQREGAGNLRSGGRQP